MPRVRMPIGATTVAFRVSAIAIAGAASAQSVIRVTPQQAHRIGLRLARAAPADAVPVATVAATITPPVGGRVAVAAPFPGIVRDVRVVEGQAVRRGQVLATVISREVLQTGAELARSRSQLGVAQSQATRAAALARAGVIAGARVEEARASLAQSRTSVSENSRILALAGADGRSGSYILRAPIAGRVSSMQITTGARVDGTSAPFVIDANGRFALTAQLPARYAGQVHPGMRVMVLPGVFGVIRTVGATIDPQTRSLMVSASVPAAPGVLAGRSLSVVILAASPAGAVQVPAGAVTSDRGRTIVYERVGQGFAPRVVQVAGRNAARAVLSSGLSVGAVVAVSGVAELKSVGSAR